MTTPLIGIPEIAEGVANQVPIHNTALRHIEAKMIRALSMIVMAPPAAVEGDSYIIPSGASGAWSGKSNQIAAFIGGAWTYAAPIEGVRLWINDLDAEYVYDGAAWVANGGDSSSQIADAIAAHEAASDPHPQYMTQAEADARYAASGDSETDLNAHIAAADPHTQYQKESEKGAANGYASLGSDGKVPTSQLPSLGGGGGGGSGMADTVPALADFSWVGKLNAVATQESFGISMRVPGTGNDQLECLVMPVPAAPYTATARIKTLQWARNFVNAGLVWYESGSGRLHTVGPSYTTGATPSATTRFIRWNSATNGYNEDEPARGGAGDIAMFGNFEWMRLRDDGTDRFFEMSLDGKAWTTIYKLSGRTTWITPTHVGIFLDPIQTTTPFVASLLTLFSWTITQP